MRFDYLRVLDDSIAIQKRGYDVSEDMFNIFYDNELEMDLTLTEASKRFERAIKAMGDTTNYHVLDTIEDALL